MQPSKQPKTPSTGITTTLDDLTVRVCGHRFQFMAQEVDSHSKNRMEQEAVPTQPDQTILKPGNNISLSRSVSSSAHQIKRDFPIPY